jgi:hypothetical protein
VCKSAAYIGSGVVFCKGMSQTRVSIETGPIEAHLLTGAASFTYFDDVASTLPDWIGSHVRAPAFMGGVPAVRKLENLR